MLIDHKILNNKACTFLNVMMNTGTSRTGGTCTYVDSKIGNVQTGSRLSWSEISAAEICTNHYA